VELYLLARSVFIPMTIEIFASQEQWCVARAVKLQLEKHLVGKVFVIVI